MDIDGEMFLYFYFVLIFKIMSFGVIFRVPGFDGLLGHIFLRLAI